jgi:hypothetical protein
MDLCNHSRCMYPSCSCAPPMSNRLDGISIYPLQHKMTQHSSEFKALPLIFSHSLWILQLNEYDTRNKPQLEQACVTIFFQSSPACAISSLEMHERTLRCWSINGFPLPPPKHPSNDGTHPHQHIALVILTYSETRSASALKAWQTSGVTFPIQMHEKIAHA